MNFFEKIIDLPKTSESFVSDMEKRFHRTFLLCRANPKEDFYPVEVRDRVDASLFLFISPFSNSEVNIKTSTLEVQPFLPDTGYYNLKTRLFYLTKDPQRQWKRSFCPSIYTLNSPINTDMQWGRTNTASWTECARAICNNKYTSLDSIKQKDAVPTALSLSFAFSYNERENKHQLIYRRVPVATLDFEKKEIVDVVDFMHQEIQDLLYRTNVKSWKLT